MCAVIIYFSNQVWLCGPSLPIHVLDVADVTVMLLDVLLDVLH